MIRTRHTPPRLCAILLSLGLLAACTDAPDPTGQPLEPMGDFLLGHNIVTVNEPAVSPVSRRASDAEWQAMMEKAIDRRFGTYDGTRYYHLGISVDGYALAPPGVPLVVAPKSVLLISVTVWDDATQTKLNPKPERITVFEGLSADTMIGSGITRDKQEQMETLAGNAAEAVHRWLQGNLDWFERDGPAEPALDLQDNVEPAPAAAPPGEPPGEPAVQTVLITPLAEPAEEAAN